MNCRSYERHLDAMVDDELDPTSLIEVERHLSECALCQEQVALARSLKRQLRAAAAGVTAPSGLRAAVVRSALEEQRSHRGANAMPARYAVPLAAAATVLLALVGTTGLGGLNLGPRSTVRAGALPVLEDVINLQRSDLPADVSNTPPQHVASYFANKVEFPVRPPRFKDRAVKLVGARLSHIRERRAAALYYDANGQRLTVVVFEHPEAVEEGAVRVRLGDREVTYHELHGHTVPMVRRHGLTYAFAGDLDRSVLLRLAANAEVSP